MKTKRQKDQLERNRIMRNPMPIRGIIYGLIIYYIIGLFAGAIVGAVVGLFFQHISDGGVEELQIFINENDKIISIIVYSICALVAILSGYICSKYSKRHVYRYSLLMLLPMVILNIWAYDALWEQIFLTVTTFIGVLAGTYIQQLIVNKT